MLSVQILFMQDQIASGKVAGVAWLLLISSAEMADVAVNSYMATVAVRVMRPSIVASGITLMATVAECL